MYQNQDYGGNFSLVAWFDKKRSIIDTQLCFVNPAYMSHWFSTSIPRRNSFRFFFLVPITCDFDGKTILLQSFQLSFAFWSIAIFKKVPFVRPNWSAQWKTNKGHMSDGNWLRKIFVNTSNLMDQSQHKRWMLSIMTSIHHMAAGISICTTSHKKFRPACRNSFMHFLNNFNRNR